MKFILFIFMLCTLSDAYNSYTFDLKDVILADKQGNRFIEIILKDNIRILLDYYAGKDTCNRKFAEFMGQWEDYKKCKSLTNKQ